MQVSPTIDTAVTPPEPEAAFLGLIQQVGNVGPSAHLQMPRVRLQNHARLPAPAPAAQSALDAKSTGKALQIKGILQSRSATRRGITVAQRALHRWRRDALHSGRSARVNPAATATFFWSASSVANSVRRLTGASSPPLANNLTCWLPGQRLAAPNLIQPRKRLRPINRGRTRWHQPGNWFSFPDDLDFLAGCYAA